MGQTMTCGLLELRSGHARDLCQSLCTLNIVMCPDGPKSLFGFEFLDVDYSGLWPNHRECSKTTGFELEETCPSNFQETSSPH